MRDLNQIQCKYTDTDQTAHTFMMTGALIGLASCQLADGTCAIQANEDHPPTFSCGYVGVMYVQAHGQGSEGPLEPHSVQVTARGKGRGSSNIQDHCRSQGMWKPSESRSMKKSGGWRFVAGVWWLRLTQQGNGRKNLTQSCTCPPHQFDITQPFRSLAQASRLT